MDKDAPDHHPCSSYMAENFNPPMDLKVKPGTCRPRKIPKSLPSKECDFIPVKMCCPPPILDPPPEMDPCREQKIRNIIKAGYKLCPEKPKKEAEKVAPCLALCKERIKNFHPASDSPYPSSHPVYPPGPC